MASTGDSVSAHSAVLSPRFLAIAGDRWFFVFFRKCRDPTSVCNCFFNVHLISTHVRVSPPTKQTTASLMHLLYTNTVNLYSNAISRGVHPNRCRHHRSVSCPAVCRPPCRLASCTDIWPWTSSKDAGNVTDSGVRSPSPRNRLLPWKPAASRPTDRCRPRSIG